MLLNDAFQWHEYAVVNDKIIVNDRVEETYREAVVY